jgi:copper(I)-binding protein
MTRFSGALLLTVCAAGSVAAEPLTSADAWIRAAPPGARTAAAYLTISNAGPADCLLGGATVSTPTAPSVPYSNRHTIWHGWPDFGRIATHHAARR